MTHLQALIGLELAEVLLQEQQVDAQVVVPGRDQAQRPEAGQELVGFEEPGALPRRAQGGVDHQGGEEDVHRQVGVAEEAEDADRHQLTLHRLRHHAVVLQHAGAQVAGELVGEGGQRDVVAQVGAGEDQGEEGQAPAGQVLQHQVVGEPLGLQVLLHQRVLEAALGQVQSTAERG